MLLFQELPTQSRQRRPHPKLCSCQGHKHRLSPVHHSNLCWPRGAPGPVIFVVALTEGYPVSPRWPWFWDLGASSVAWRLARKWGPRVGMTPASSGKAHEVGVSHGGASSDFGTRLEPVLGSAFYTRKEGGASSSL